MPLQPLRLQSSMQLGLHAAAAQLLPAAQLGPAAQLEGQDGDAAAPPVMTKVGGFGSDGGGV